jgi:hypothetical protein
MSKRGKRREQTKVGQRFGKERRMDFQLVCCKEMEINGIC